MSTVKTKCQTVPKRNGARAGISKLELMGESENRIVTDISRQLFKWAPSTLLNRIDPWHSRPNMTGSAGGICTRVGEGCAGKLRKKDGGLSRHKWTLLLHRKWHVWKVLSRSNQGVPVVVQWLTNPTGNHEVVGSIPGLVSGLTIRCCCELWCKSQTRLRSRIAVALA